MLLVVNYHYVARERDPGARAIFPVPLPDFEAQLDELGRAFEFVTRDDVLRAVDGAASLPERACLITFDDGLAEQFELALPALEARGVPALFFVCGRPLVERRVLFTHKVHYLRESIPDHELLAAVTAHLAAAKVEVEPVSDAMAAAAYRYDAVETGRLKYLLNVLLGPQQPEAVDRIFAERFSEQELSERLYASRAQVEELGSRGFLGAHGYAHLPLAQLDRTAARADVEQSAATLEAIAGTRPRAFSYPYGTPAAVTADSARVLEECGFAIAFTLERAFNATLDEPLLLARLDTNDAPAGNDPLFVVDGGEIELRGGLTAGRTRYVEEAA